MVLPSGGRVSRRLSLNPIQLVVSGFFVAIYQDFSGKQGIQSIFQLIAVILFTYTLAYLTF